MYCFQGSNHPRWLIINVGEKIANCTLIIRIFRCQMEHEKIANCTLIIKSFICQMEHEKIANCSLIIRTFRCQMEHEKISNELWLVWTNMDIYVISGGPKEKYIIAVKKNPTLRLDIIWGSFLSSLIVLKGQLQKIAMKKNIIVFVRI